MFRRLLSHYSSSHSRQRAALFLIVTVLLSLGVSSQIGIVRAANLIVNQPDDTPDNGLCDAICTLPEAINDAGAGDTISFNVGGGGAQTIFLSAALPPINAPITIDGASQGGATCATPSLTINGGGLVLTAGTGSTIQGLAITGASGDGILVNGADNTQITCNKFTLNGGNGVNVAAGTGNTISQNSFANNAADGIVLSGGNNGQLAPALTSAESDGVNGTTIAGTLAGGAGNYTIEFFQCDSDNDEGETLLGTLSPVTPGPINFTAATSLNPPGDAVTATATNNATGDTSEFATCVPVTGKAIYQSNPADGSPTPITLNTSVGTILGDNIANIQVTNPGNAQLDITAINLTGAGFTLLTPPPPPNISVAAGDVITGTTISVECDVSTATGGTPYTGTLTVTHNAAGSPAIYTLECNVAALPVPDYDSVPPPGSTINFFDVTVGFTSTFTLRVDSAGTGPLTITSDNITGPEAAEFSILSGLPITNLGGGGFSNVIIECAPTALLARNADLTFTTNDPDAAEATITYPITCNGVPPVITVTSIPPGPTLPDTFEGDTSYSIAFDGTGGTGPYTIAQAGGTIPLGMMFVGNVLSGIPTTAGTYNFTVTAEDSLGLGFISTPFPYSIVVRPPIVVGPPGLPAGTVGVAYPSTFITATGGSGTYNSYVISPPGGQPPGLNINTLTGEITGTPTDSSGSPYAFDVTVTDSLGATGVQSYSITINPGITVTPPTLPNGTVGVAYNQTIGATGGSGTYANFAVTAGSLPPPLALNPTSGAITGTPNTAGTYPFSITVTDSLGNTGTLAYSVTINPAITVTPPTLPNGTVGVAYNQTIGATGGSGTYANFAVTAGSLPPPLALNPTSGAITGTPNTAGTYPFTVTVTDSLGATGALAYSVTINPAITVTPPTLPNGTVGVAYNQTIGATGGSGTYANFAVTAGSLPPPLALNPTSGAITGTPNTAGTYPFTVTVTDSLGATGALAYSLTIDPGSIVVQPATLPNGTVGAAYNQTISAIGGSGTYVNFAVTVGSLPPPLTLDPATGALTGTPNTAGTYPFTVTVTDSLGATGTLAYSVTINPAITVTPATLPNGTVGVAYNQTIGATGGSGTYVNFAVTVGALPPPLTLDPATGALTGTPNTIGMYPFSITVTDSLGATGTLAYSVTIDPGPIVVTPPTLPNGTVGVAYNQTIGATGGSGTYANFAVTVGSLPPPLTLDPATGALTGTPNTVGTYPFSITVTDLLGATGTLAYSVTINPAPAPIYSSNPPPGSATPIDLLSSVLTVPTTNANAIVVSNPGTAQLDITNILLGGANPGDFSFTPATFNVPAGTLPPGGTPISITCTPTALGVRTATLTVTHNATGSPAVYNLQCTGIAAPALALTPTTVANGTELVVYTPITLTPSGGLAPYTLTSTGTVPTGMTLDLTTTPGIAVLSGTPAAGTAGPYSFSITVTDSLGTPLTVAYPFTINPPGTITLGGLPSPNGAINVAYSQSFSVTPAGTYTFTLTGGTLPPGLALSPSGTSGTISGTPTATGTYTFTVQADNGAGGTASRNYTIVISQPIYASNPVPSSTINIGTVQIGTAISFNLVISNNGLAPATLVVNPGTPAPPANGPISGLNYSDFTITNPSPFLGLSIAGVAGSTVTSRTLTIQCIPSASGLRIAILTLKTNDPTKPTVQYALACTGSGTAVPTATPIGFVATVTPFVIPPTAVLPATGTVEEVKGLAMRTGPYLGATLVGKLVPGISYSILARSNDEGGGITWYLVTTEEGVTGWVSGLYFQVSGNIDAVPFQGSIFDQIDGAPDTGITARAMSIIDIRRRPSGRAAIIGQIPHNGTMSLLGRTRQNGGDFWVQVNYNEIIGWIPAAPISVNGFTSNVPIR